ncbi:hypothetical protein Tco_0783645, partial [Tanacetum coccineum]
VQDGDCYECSGYKHS